MKLKYIFHFSFLIAILIATFNVDLIESQTPLGGCGYPGYSNLIVDPFCGNNLNVADYCLTDYNQYIVQFPINALNQGIYATVQRRRIGGSSPCQAKIYLSFKTLSVDESNNPTLENDCGLEYNIDYIVYLNSTPGVDTCNFAIGNFFIPYNLCQSIDSVTGGDFFFRYSTYTNTYYQYSHSYPESFTTPISTYMTSGLDYYRSLFFQVCGEQYYFINDYYPFVISGGISDGNSFNSSFVVFSDVVIISYSDDLPEKIFFLYKPSNNSIHIAQMNKTTITFLDSAPYVGGTVFPPSGEFYTSNFLFNTNTGYLYGFDLDSLSTFLIYQVDMINWIFIRWKKILISAPGIGTDFGIRMITIGLDNQIIATGFQGAISNPNGYGPYLFCIKDPWNMVYLGTSTVNTSATIPKNSPFPMTNLANTGCFPQNYFLGQYYTGTNGGTFMNFCGSGITNNASYCNTDRSGIDECCPLECIVDNNPCGVGAECHDAAVCVSVNTCDIINYYNTSVECGLTPNECTPTSYCNGNGACSQKPFSSTSTSCGIDPTSCLDESFCDGMGSCIQQPFEPNTTVCEDSNPCHGIAYCTGVNQSCGSYVNILNPGDQCGNETICINASYCDASLNCIPNYFSNDTQCGSPIFNHLCLKNNTCSGVSDVCHQNFQPAGTTCYESFGSSIHYGKCNANGICVFQEPIWNVSIFNITNLTFVESNNDVIYMTNTAFFFLFFLFAFLILIWIFYILKTYFLFLSHK